MQIEETHLSAPVEQKIAWAQDRYQESGDRLRRSRAVSDLLDRLKNAIRMSGEKMARSGLARLCRECDRDEGGSCCGAGLENRYNGWLLLINLLLHTQLPKDRIDPQSCFFLGKTGCLLQARHVICVNYVCKKISLQIDPGQLAALREKEGEELETLFLLHEEVKKTLRQSS
ncbi:MAG: hypothetical protein GY849_08470 [Deltaproteobacteria bacterium]|nr:hypothetical protein [Deltaproteobacteria bacterium]